MISNIHFVTLLVSFHVYIVRTQEVEGKTSQDLMDVCFS